MPEGHKIHRQAQYLAAAFAGKALAVSSPQGRFAKEAATLDGTVLKEVFAWGKHLFLDFSGTYVHVHLGLYGDWRAKSGPNARLGLRDGSRSIYLSGPTTCELLDEGGVRAVLSRLGPDPLRNGSGDKERFVGAVRAKAVPVGKLVMNQAIVAGPGNIYRAECLFRTAINPYRKGKNIAASRLASLWEDLVEAMGEGLRTGVIDTLQTCYKREGASETDRRFAVYHRAGKPCPRCGRVVKEALLEGRRLFWCPNCQK